jgi:DNA-damage-inducible protein J
MALCETLNGVELGWFGIVPHIIFSTSELVKGCWISEGTLVSNCILSALVLHLLKWYNECVLNWRINMSTANLTVRIDAGIKSEAEKLFEDLGMSISTAFNIFLRQAVRAQAIPFTISRGITNRTTLAAMREAEQIANDPAVPSFATRESLIASLEA